MLHINRGESKVETQVSVTDNAGTALSFFVSFFPFEKQSKHYMLAICEVHKVRGCSAFSSNFR